MPRSLQEDWKALFISGKASDVSFVIGDEIIPAHKSVLIARVPFFDKMFASGMSEAESGVVKIDDDAVDAATYKECLQFIYTDILPSNLDENAASLLPLADKYDLPVLRGACEAALKKGLLKENVCQLLILADLFHCSSLKESCLRHIKTWGKSLDKSTMDNLKPYPDLLIEVITSYHHH